MVGPYNLPRPNETEERKNQHTTILSGSNPILRKTHPKSIQKDQQHETTTKKGTKWDLTKERKIGFNTLKREPTSQPCQAPYNGNNNHFVTTNACIALWERQNNGDLKRNAFASRYLHDAKRSVWSASGNYQP